jgi:hypothetical protein
VGLKAFGSSSTPERKKRKAKRASPAKKRAMPAKPNRA